MTSVSLDARRSRPVIPAAELLAAMTVAAGCVALVSRPTTGAYLGVTIAVGIAGILHPVVRSDPGGARVWTVAVAVGVAAFALARGVLGGSLVPPATVLLMGKAIAAAVAEEAFFRRFVYAACLRWGVPVALAASSSTFAIVHVTVWGWRAFPVDLAAGLLLGWQRWATGSWTAPATTHVAANVLMLL